MWARRYKGIMQNAIVLALIVCIGYGFYMYNLLQNRKEQYKALSSQMQVAYEEKATLEKVIKKMKIDCEKQNEQKEELIQGMLVEHQDKYEVLLSANKKLEVQKSTLSQETKTLELRYDAVVREHENLKTKHKESLTSFSKDINMAQEDLKTCQTLLETYTEEKANLEGQLQNLRVNHENVLKSLKIIPRDAVNFNHPAFKDTSENTIHFVNSLLGESQEKLIQLVKREDNAEQHQEIDAQPVKLNVEKKKFTDEEINNQTKQKTSSQNNPERVAKDINQEADLKNSPQAPAVLKNQVIENIDHEGKSHMQVKDEQKSPLVHAIDRVGNVQPTAMEQGAKDEEKNPAKTENPKKVVKLENAPPNVEMDIANEPDDPFKDLGGPIGDEMVHDLGAKEAENVDTMQDMKQPDEQEGPLYDDGKEKEIDDDQDIDDPEENDDLQIEDDENDIHKAIVHDEEDPDPDAADEKDSVQVVLPPAARVSDEELEVAVNAPPGHDKVEGDVMPNGIGLEVYEHENYDARESLNEEDNVVNHEKTQEYYNDEDSEKERVQRIIRNNQRENFDRQFEVMRDVQKKIAHGANL